MRKYALILPLAAAIPAALSARTIGGFDPAAQPVSPIFAPAPSSSASPAAPAEAPEASLAGLTPTRLAAGLKAAAAGLTVEFEPECMYLHPTVSYTGYHLSNSYAMIPAYAEVKFKNYSSEGITDFEWNTYSLELNSTSTAYVTAERMSGTDTDYSYTTEYGVYSGTTLEGYTDSGTSSYSWGANCVYADANMYAYCGCQYSTFVISNDSSYPLISRATYDFGYASYGALGTPGVNTAGYSISDLIFYQGVPTAPLYCTGIDLMVGAAAWADNGVSLSCIIRRASRDENGDLTLGEVIAQSDSLTYLESSLTVQLQFADFYSYDDDGQRISHSYMFLDEEFAVQISGWDNGTFVGKPLGEYAVNCNTNSLPTTFCYLTGSDTLQTYNYYARMYVGFRGAVYGFLHTEDDTSLSFDAAGGSAKISVVPLLCSVGVSSAKKSTRVYYDSQMTPDDWISVSITDESYTSSDDWYFELTVAADSLPAGTSSRECTFRLFQEGSYLDITVAQSDESGVTAAAATSARATAVIRGNTLTIAGDTGVATLYDTAGRVVASGAEQIDVSDLPVGIYVVRLSDGSAVKVAR